MPLRDKLFPRLQLLFSQLGLPCRYGISPEDTADLKDWAAPMAHAFIVYMQSVSKGANADVGVVITISPASQGDLGLVFAPFGDLNLSRQVGSWTVAAQVAASVDVLAWGRNGPALLATSGATDLTASVTATLPPPAQGPAVVFGAPTGTRLEVGGATASAAAHLAQTGSSLALNADVTKSKLVIAGGDSFVSSLLPDNGLEANFDLGIGWSSDKGLTLRGSAGLQTDLPVSLSVGGVTLSQLHLALLAGDAGVSGEISGILSASIGPVQAAIDRVGIAANLSFPDKGGNLGGGELAVGFKPPSGVGIALDMQGLTGGGFLTHDEATGNYGGVLQLSLQETITLTGYGIIGTKMPDGSPGYSLLVFITAEDFGGIQLGFGLVLQSIGGMVGIHRTFDLNVIRSGLRSDSLATLLFPRDPVANAPALLQALAASFPARQGSYLFGLLARITWLTPTVVQADLAVILELGQRSRLLVLGRVSAMLPSHDNDLIRLILDADGVLDFNAKTFDADAVLVDSRIAHQFPVTGSAAVRSSWNDNANFVLAAGGLNPHFAPPTGFPQLERVAIALCSGNNPRLICDAYLAVTANTVQFGSRVSLYAEAFSFSITGDLGFDALVTLEPPHFLIDFHASVQLKQGSTNLFKVTVDGTLEGPLPLRLHAKASFEILWFDFSVNFDFTLANGNPGQLPAPAVALEGKVMAALADPTNWTAQHEASLASGVAFRALPAGAPPVLDPLGQFTVKQQVAPLNTQRAIDTYGGATVAGAKHFALVAAFNNQPATPVGGAFVPARYFTMSDDDKLAAPSFETMDAGVALGDGSVSFDAGGHRPRLGRIRRIRRQPGAGRNRAGSCGFGRPSRAGALQAADRRSAGPAPHGRGGPGAGAECRRRALPQHRRGAGGEDHDARLAHGACRGDDAGRRQGARGCHHLECGQGQPCDPGQRRRPLAGRPCLRTADLSERTDRHDECEPEFSALGATGRRRGDRQCGHSGRDARRRRQRVAADDPERDGRDHDGHPPSRSGRCGGDRSEPGDSHRSARGHQ